jgi:16S rRNA (guanine527-N7)-methyltransferase
MSEDDARAWLAAHFGDRIRKLEELVDLVLTESARQNLISSATLPEIWARHILDSAQLIELARSKPGPWLDIGTGAGFPGMVAAVLGRAVTMVEPRRKRVEFLSDCIKTLGVQGNSRVIHSKVEAMAPKPFAVISARAVASLPNLLAVAVACSNPDTIWLLPKGRNADAEVAEARRAWHGVFHVERSITDPSSLIVIATGVSRR